MTIEESERLGRFERLDDILQHCGGIYDGERDVQLKSGESLKITRVADCFDNYTGCFIVRPQSQQ